MKLFFFCPDQKDKKIQPFDYAIICLAQGLQNLGFEFWGSRNYWIKDEKKPNLPLFKGWDSHDLSGFDTIILTTKFYIENHYEIPNGFFDTDRDYTIILIDNHDGNITPSFKIADKVNFVLKWHYNKKFTYPKNVFPWAFGLSNRVISRTQPLDGENRSEKVVCTYRVSHSLRKKADKKVKAIIEKFFPIDETREPINNINTLTNDIDILYNEITCGRHSPAYYKRLRTSLMSLCFGGFLTNKYLVNDLILTKIFRRINYDLEIIKNDRVFQWDSWRLWETLAAGSAAIHLDFEKYGMQLPVNPVNGEHYIGVDFENTKELSLLLKDADLITTIGAKGRKWALKHYSPKAVAFRMLQFLKKA